MPHEDGCEVRGGSVQPHYNQEAVWCGTLLSSCGGDGDWVPGLEPSYIPYHAVSGYIRIQLLLVLELPDWDVLCWWSIYRRGLPSVPVLGYQEHVCWLESCRDNAPQSSHTGLLIIIVELRTRYLYSLVNNNTKTLNFAYALACLDYMNWPWVCILGVKKLLIKFVIHFHQ